MPSLYSEISYNTIFFIEMCFDVALCRVSLVGTSNRIRSINCAKALEGINSQNDTLNSSDSNVEHPGIRSENQPLQVQLSLACPQVHQLDIQVVNCQGGMVVSDLYA